MRNVLLPADLDRAMNPKFIAEIAVGWEDEKVIALRYGIDEKTWQLLRKNKEFMAEVSRVRSEFEKDGNMTRLRARMMSIDLMERIYAEAQDPDTPMSAKLDAFKTFANMADMMPRANVKGDSGPGFQIQINLTQDAPVATLKAIDIEESEGDNDGKRKSKSVPRRKKVCNKAEEGGSGEGVGSAAGEGLCLPPAEEQEEPSV
jgi:hypothetical protein